jgi:hypothetical protein
MIGTASFLKYSVLKERNSLKEKKKYSFVDFIFLLSIYHFKICVLVAKSTELHSNYIATIR